MDAASCRSILARQQDGVVAEIQADFLEREIRERNPLRANDVAVAVLASEDAGVLVEIDSKFPELEFLRRNGFFIALGQGDFVEKPISAAGIRDIFRAVSEEDAAHEPWRYQFSEPVKCRSSSAVSVFVVVMVLSPLRMGCAIAADACRVRRRSRESGKPFFTAGHIRKGVARAALNERRRGQRPLSNVGASAATATAQGRIV